MKAYTLGPEAKLPPFDDLDEDEQVVMNAMYVLADGSDSYMVDDRSLQTMVSQYTADELKAMALGVRDRKVRGLS